MQTAAANTNKVECVFRDAPPKGGAIDLHSYLTSLIVSHEAHRVKPVLITVLMEKEQYQQVIDQLTPASAFRGNIYDNNTEGIVIEYCGLKFKIHKP